MLYPTVIEKILNDGANTARTKGVVGAQTAAIEAILASVYQVSPTWLRELKVIQTGPARAAQAPGRLHRSEDQEAGQGRQGHHAQRHPRQLAAHRERPVVPPQIHELRLKVEGAWAAKKWDDVLAHLTAFDTIGAGTDAANYGTIYEVGFELDNTSNT